MKDSTGICPKCTKFFESPTELCDFLLQLSATHCHHSREDKQPSVSAPPSYPPHPSVTEKPMEIYLSERAREIVERKATANGRSISDIVEWMVLEFSKSTPEELEAQKIRKQEAYNKFKKENSFTKLQTYSEIVHKAWGDGWGNGWLHFQIRKFSNPFKMEV